MPSSTYALNMLHMQYITIGEDAAAGMGSVAAASTEVYLHDSTVAWDTWSSSFTGAIRQGGRCKYIRFWGDTKTKYGAGITALGKTLGWQRTEYGVYIILEEVVG